MYGENSIVCLPETLWNQSFSTPCCKVSFLSLYHCHFGSYALAGILLKYQPIIVFEMWESSGLSHLWPSHTELVFLRVPLPKASFSRHRHVYRLIEAFATQRLSDRIQACSKIVSFLVASTQTPRYVT